MWPGSTRSDLARTAEAILTEAGRIAAERARAAQPGRRPARHPVRGWARHHAAGLAGGLPHLDGGRLERADRPRPITAGRGLPKLIEAACTEMWNAANLAFALCPLLTQGGGRGAGGPRLRGAEGALPREARLRRMDRHHEPDRAAGRLRPRRAAHPGRAGGRRHLPDHRPEDLHHLRRARSRRQHRPSRAGAAAGRAGGHARHLAVPGAEVPVPDGSSGAQRSALLRHRAQAGHPRLADLLHGVRRRGRRHRLADRRGEPRPRLHVHDDEQRRASASASQGVAVAERATQRALAYAHERRQGRAVAPPRRRARSSRIPTCSGCCSP